MTQDAVPHDEHGDGRLRTRHHRMLAKLDAVIPWPSLEREARKRRPKAGDGRGTHEPSVMLRIYVLQRLCGLSDLDMMEHLCLFSPMRQFAGLGEGDGFPEDGEISKFRRMLEERGLARRILRIVSRRLARHGIERQEIADVLVIRLPNVFEIASGKRAF